MVDCVEVMVSDIWHAAVVESSACVEVNKTFVHV
jgi:hypothetical protein